MAMAAAAAAAANSLSSRMLHSESIPGSSSSSSASSSSSSQASSLSSVSSSFLTLPFLPRCRLRLRQCRRTCLQAVRATSASSSSPSSPSSAMYAKEMERIAAKEALLLAIKDAGGENALLAVSASPSARIDVNERIVSLERLNPTPRPTTSPLLEGLWMFKWIGAGSPGQLAARVLLQRFPSSVATLSELTLLILDGSAKATATLKVLNTIITSIVLTSKLTVEGPLRLKEEYSEGLLSTPAIQEGAVPAQVQNAYDQVLNAVQRLPEAAKEILSNGVKIPLAGSFERQMLISYLDDEILVARDESGAPEVLYKLTSSTSVDAEPVSEYVS